MRSRYSVALLITLVSFAGVAYACEETALIQNGSNPAATPPAADRAAPPATDLSQGNSDRAIALLDAHNVYRTEVGVPPLVWSDELAASAQVWADELAATNTFAHSEADGYGENLWKGTAGAYSLTDMVTAWGDEKQYFIPNAPFPQVSTTGNWADVGHYTQIIWRDTTDVGCAIATGNGWDVLVCHYAPPGNYMGQEPL